MKFITDDGHGWLAVDLNEYPSARNFGTGYGYINDRTNIIYLEEDCEAYAFLKSLWDGDTSKARDLPHEVIDGYALLRKLPNNEAVFDTSKLYG